MSGEVRSLLALGAASLLWSATPLAHAEAQDDVRFGTVHFQTSCNDLAQRRFDRAMRYEHSFWYREAQQIFEEALAAEKTPLVRFARSPHPHLPDAARERVYGASLGH